MSKTRKATLLDVDPSIIENNLLLECNREQEKEMERLFPNLETSEPPSKFIRPTPGFCIKTKKVDGSKVFINVCRTEAIPKPEDITEERLAEILRTDEATDYRVPMSIGNPREEPDKSGKPSDVYDVAVNEHFFCSIENSQLFRSFLFQVVFEAVQQKYDIELQSDEFVVLKNRKAMGVLQQHRIQVREPQTASAPRPLIQEITSNSAEQSRKRVAPSAMKLGREESAPSVTAHTLRQPMYRLIQHPSDKPDQEIIGEFKMEGVTSIKDMTLDVGEDRLTLEARRHSYLLDIFLPFKLNTESVSAKFDPQKALLTVKMPVITSC